MDRRHAFIALAFFCCGTAAAIAKPQVSIHLSAFVISQKDGKQTETPLANAPVGAGERVKFVLDANNGGTSPALHFTPSDPIPKYMTYVPGSAQSQNSTLEFSLDGKTFSPHPAIKIKTAKGFTMKAADPSMYRAIRWITRVPLPAKHTFTYSYEAQVNGLKKGAK